MLSNVVFRDRRWRAMLALCGFVAVQRPAIAAEPDARPGCDEACRACNMSIRDLRANYGVTETPERFRYASRFLEGAGMRAFEACIQEIVGTGLTAADVGCDERSHNACVRACEAAVPRSPAPAPRPAPAASTSDTSAAVRAPAALDARARAIARKKYPSDADMQEYVYKKQLASGLFMQTAKDAQIARGAQQRYPDDFDMQQFVYEKQLAAKQVMAGIPDSVTRRIAIAKYPEDFDMQKFVYDKQEAARVFMASVPDSPQRREAVRRYPNDFDMQKYVYEASAR
jgi:hypothetical protein